MRNAASRREFLKESALGAAVLAALGYGLEALTPGEALAKAGIPIRIGGCDWSLAQEGKLEAFRAAKESGLDGVEVSCGKESKEKSPGRLSITGAERQKAILAAAKESGLEVPSTCLEILHRDGLKEHADAPRWVEQAIEATKALGAKVILLPFFGSRSIEKREEQQKVAERLKPLAPLAEKAGVVLGLENTISARDNAWILEQVASKAVKVYYDIGNSHHWKHDLYEEIPWLGKDRIAQIHLKDGGSRLGKGAIDLPRIVDSILRSGFEGWAMLETAVVTNLKDDFTANAGAVRKLMEEKRGAAEKKKSS